ncbi:hypothetical protein Q664_10925 [Archangium violaceum Cb vi76]|uniref:Uncharacterized protein n=1 Tax=Archangium violaceum Cb vi76 TaxID=1406225 RepID=A0A084SXK8_9BACT|nr:hypothetical protein Q664_10925 [Archangium violaceum Cb vi76]
MRRVRTWGVRPGGAERGSRTVKVIPSRLGGGDLDAAPVGPGTMFEPWRDRRTKPVTTSVRWMR